MELEEQITSLRTEIDSIKAENEQLRKDVIEAYKTNTKAQESVEQPIDFDNYCKEHYDKRKGVNK